MFPHRVLALFAPALAEVRLEVLQTEQEAEEKLVTRECDAADNERKWEGHVVVEYQRLVACDVLVVRDVVGVGGCVVRY